MSLAEALEYLVNLSQAADPRHRGVRLDLQMTEAEKALPGYRIDYYRFNRAPFTEVLQSIIMNKRLSMEVTSNSIVIKPVVE